MADGGGQAWGGLALVGLVLLLFSRGVDGVGQQATTPAGLRSGSAESVRLSPAPGALTDRRGTSLLVGNARVLSVPADEGFWIEAADGRRIWTQLEGSGESPYTVRPGDRVSFEARIVGHGRGFPERVGVNLAEGSFSLARQRVHLVADADAVRFDR